MNSLANLKTVCLAGGDIAATIAMVNIVSLSYVKNKLII
jgi:hypothetical protein